MNILDFSGGSKFLKEGVLRSKHLSSESTFECPITYSKTLSRPHHFGPPGGRFAFCRWCGIAAVRQASVPGASRLLFDLVDGAVTL